MHVYLFGDPRRTQVIAAALSAYVKCGVLEALPNVDSGADRSFYLLLPGNENWIEALPRVVASEPYSHLLLLEEGMNSYGSVFGHLALRGVELVAAHSNDAVSSALRGIVGRAQQLAIHSTCNAMNSTWPLDARLLVERCILVASRPCTVAQMAARMRVDRKTLFNLFRTAQLPPPSFILSWSRILIATQLLENPSMTVDGVARTLHHQSGTSLRNMLKRYVGVTPTKLRSLGSIDYSTSAFLSSIDRNRSTLRFPGIAQFNGFDVEGCL